jgi:hypothetical protein
MADRRSGVIFLEADTHGKGLRLTRPAEAVRDLLMIGALKEPLGARLRRAKARVSQFRDAATEYFVSREITDMRLRVDNETEILIDRVRQEIHRRAGCDDLTGFLEGIEQHLCEQPSVLR